MKSDQKVYYNITIISTLAKTRILITEALKSYLHHCLALNTDIYLIIQLSSKSYESSLNNPKLGSLACIFIALINSNRNDLVLTYFRKKNRRCWKLCLRISKIKSVSRTKRHSNNYFTVAVIEYVVGSLFFYRCSHVSVHRVIKETFADDLPWNVNTIQLFHYHITISMFGIIH